jgi:hypothetical protein
MKKTPEPLISCQSKNPLKSRNKLIYDFDIISFQPGKSLTKIADIARQWMEAIALKLPLLPD